jgi:two-component system chemotaxis response regulator CheY
LHPLRLSRFFMLKKSLGHAEPPYESARRFSGTCLLTTVSSSISDVACVNATSGIEVLIMEEKLLGISDLPVLIIDDIKSARVLLSDMLKEMGFPECIEARDGSEALEKLKSTPVQLILCDFLMDGMSGIEFLNQLQEHSEIQHAPVIFVSAVGDVSSVESAMKRGATDYLVKPVSFRKFKRKIENTLGLQTTNDQPVYQ